MSPSAGVTYTSLPVWAARHGIPLRLAQLMAAEGRIEGAERILGRWGVPVDAEPPEPKRRGRPPKPKQQAGA